MSTSAGRHGDHETPVLLAGVLVVGVVGATVLDHAPWVLPWAIAAVLLVRITDRVAIRRRRVIGRRSVWRPAAAGVIMAIIVWGGSGVALNRDARRQLRARPAAAIAAYVHQHTPHTHPRTRQQRRRVQRRRHALSRSPAARLYGVKQLGDWHWQRLIVGDSALLGGPFALWGIAVGLALARRRQRRTPGQTLTPSLASVGQSSLRTAGRRQ
jgi:hypothetical protein